MIRSRLGDVISLDPFLLRCGVFQPQQDWVRPTCHVPPLNENRGTV